VNGYIFEQDGDYISIINPDTGREVSWAETYDEATDWCKRRG